MAGEMLRCAQHDSAGTRPRLMPDQPDVNAYGSALSPFISTEYGALAAQQLFDTPLHAFLTLPGHTSKSNETSSVASKDRKRRASLDSVLFGV